MSEKPRWRPISTIPAEYRDGRVVELRRIYEGRLITADVGRWGTRAADAPARKPIWSPSFYPPLEELQAQRDANCDRPHWTTEDRMYAFPEPTHWREAEPYQKGQKR